MPELRIYVKSKPFSNLMKECKGDILAVRHKIVELVNEKYG
jgi:hypothetical protein